MLNGSSLGPVHDVAQEGTRHVLGSVGRFKDPLHGGVDHGAHSSVLVACAGSNLSLRERQVRREVDAQDVTRGRGIGT